MIRVISFEIEKAHPLTSPLCNAFHLAYAVSEVTNKAPSNPIVTPINGLEIANGIASKGSKSCLRERQPLRFSVFVLTILSLFSATLARQLFHLCAAKRLRATERDATRKIHTSDSHRWAGPIRDVLRARRHVSVAEVERKSGSHPWSLE